MAAARVKKAWRVPADLAEWYTAEADRRGVSENLLVTRALQHYREALPPVPAEPGTADLLDQATRALDNLGGER